MSSAVPTALDKKAQPNHVFHYTNTSGFLGIVSTGKLFASSLLYLNDRTETRFLDDLIRETAAPRFRGLYAECVKRGFFTDEFPIDQMVDHHAQLLVNGLHETSDEIAPAFVISFCRATDQFTAKHGLLSQWRGYGADGGISLQFDQEKIQQVIKSELDLFAYSHISFGDVIYGPLDIEFDEEVVPHLPKFSAAVTEIVEDILRDAGIEHRFDAERCSLEDLFVPYTQIAPRYKHPAFSAEKEYRAIFAAVRQKGLAPNSGRIVKPIHFRLRENYLLPYIEIGGGVGSKLPLSAVIVGPSREQERRRRSVRLVLDENGYSDVEVLSSEIPYA